MASKSAGKSQSTRGYNHSDVYCQVTSCVGHPYAQLSSPWNNHFWTNTNRAIICSFAWYDWVYYTEKRAEIQQTTQSTFGPIIGPIKPEVGLVVSVMILTLMAKIFGTKSWESISVIEKDPRLHHCKKMVNEQWGIQLVLHQALCYSEDLIGNHHQINLTGQTHEPDKLLIRTPIPKVKHTRVLSSTQENIFLSSRTSINWSVRPIQFQETYMHM
jgi:hypothetical protein